MKQFNQHILRNFISTSSKTQQIYNPFKDIRTCDLYGPVMIEVLDNRNKYTDYRYSRFTGASIFK